MNRAHVAIQHAPVLPVWRKSNETDSHAWAALNAAIQFGLEGKEKNACERQKRENGDCEFI